MSSLLVFTQPATGLPEVFVPQKNPDLLLKHLATVPHLSRVTPASRLEVRPAPETVSSGIAEIDVLTGGLPRGCLTEIYGPASSGRTSLLLAVLAAATWRQEACALVDVSDTFDPQSAAAAGVGFKNLLWVRCDTTPRRDKKNSLQRHRDTEESLVHSYTRPTLHGQNRAAENDLPPKKNSRLAYDREGHDRGRVALRGNRSPEFTRLEQALQAADLLLESGGFGLVAIDLSDIPVQAIGRIPLTSWFRFRRAVENTPTVLLVCAQGPCARTCASLLLRLEGQPPLIRRSEPSALSRQLSKNAASVHDGWRTVGIHNFPNLQNSWVSHQGLALAAPNPASSNCHTQPSPFREQSADHRDIGIATHAQLLNGMSIRTELRRSRLERKPTQSITAAFTTKAAWAG